MAAPNGPRLKEGSGQGLGPGCSEQSARIGAGWSLAGPHGGRIVGLALDCDVPCCVTLSQANAIGRGAKSVREFLEKNYSDEAIETDDLTVKLVIKALLEVSLPLQAGEDTSAVVSPGLVAAVEATVVLCLVNCTPQCGQAQLTAMGSLPGAPAAARAETRTGNAGWSCGTLQMLADEARGREATWRPGWGLERGARCLGPSEGCLPGGWEGQKRCGCWSRVSACPRARRVGFGCTGDHFRDLPELFGPEVGEPV